MIVYKNGVLALRASYLDKLVVKYPIGMDIIRIIIELVNKFPFFVFSIIEKI
jgi:hypothetical protein